MQTLPLIIYINVDKSQTLSLTFFLLHEVMVGVNEKKSKAPKTVH